MEIEECKDCCLPIFHHNICWWPVNVEPTRENVEYPDLSCFQCLHRADSTSTFRRNFNLIGISLFNILKIAILGKIFVRFRLFFKKAPDFRHLAIPRGPKSQAHNQYVSRLHHSCITHSILQLLRVLCFRRVVFGSLRTAVVQQMMMMRLKVASS